MCFVLVFLTVRHVGSLLPNQGSGPTLSALDGEVLTTRPPGKSLPCYLDKKKNSCCENLHKKLVESAWYDTVVLTLGSNWRRKWQPTPVFLPGESHGRRSMVGYSPRGRKELDTTEQLHFHFLSRF